MTFYVYEILTIFTQQKNLTTFLLFKQWFGSWLVLLLIFLLVCLNNFCIYKNKQMPNRRDA